MNDSSATSKMSSDSSQGLPANILKAARALLGWSQDDLANRSDVAKKTLADIERGAERKPTRRTIAAIRTTLEAAGIEFLEDNGVRLRDPESGGLHP